MSYRVAKKTTKATQYKCLAYKKHCKMIDKNIEKWGCYVECIAPNRCITTHFNARDFYCVEYEGFNTMSKSKKMSLIDKVNKQLADKEAKEHEKKYYPKNKRKGKNEGR